jgi:hypothetical protein
MGVRAGKIAKGLKRAKGAGAMTADATEYALQAVRRVNEPARRVAIKPTTAGAPAGMIKILIESGAP